MFSLTAVWSRPSVSTTEQRGPFGCPDCPEVNLFCRKSRQKSLEQPTSLPGIWTKRPGIQTKQPGFSAEQLRILNSRLGILNSKLGILDRTARNSRHNSSEFSAEQPGILNSRLGIPGRRMGRRGSRHAHIWGSRK